MRERSNAIAAIREQIAPLLPSIRNQLHELTIHEAPGRLELYFRERSTDDPRCLMLRVDVSDAARLISVPNIFKPVRVVERGVGRILIAALRTAANQLGYRLQIVELVSDFYLKLISWGAQHVAGDAVEITTTTRLSDVLPGQSTFSKLDREYLTDEERAGGYERFAADHPDMVAELDENGPHVALLLGLNFQQIRRENIVKEFERRAAQMGIDPFEELLRYAVTSSSEREEILRRRNDAKCAAVGAA